MKGNRVGNKPQVKHTEESIQKALCKWHPILSSPAMELLGLYFYAWESDYLAISQAGYVYECEIKISHSDFLNEEKHKKQKMLLLNGEIRLTQEYYNDNRMREMPMQMPNYFYYVCPEGVISESEVPKFAGLIYISDLGHFRHVKAAPKLHKEQIDVKSLKIQNKLYYAMWNWIRRYWKQQNKVKDVSAKTIYTYENLIWDKECKISDLKHEISELTCWREVTEKEPVNDISVLVKVSADDKEQIYIGSRCDDEFVLDGGKIVSINNVEWRPI